MARRFFVFFTVFVYLFFLNGYDLLTGYTCTILNISGAKVMKEFILGYVGLYIASVSTAS